jgi:phosphoribosylanthranilate isomerase
VKVKICGLTRAQDVAAAVAAGADALGFVLAPSPRQLTADQARALAALVPPFVARVGVFVDADPDWIEEMVAWCPLDWVQLHGQEPVEVCRRFGRRALKALSLRGAGDLDQVSLYDQVCGGLLLDSGRPGSGTPFNWEWLRELAPRCPFLLSGGLDPDNVARAVRQVRPWGVDVSSGVESAPGIKDAARMAAFVRAARGL